MSSCSFLFTIRIRNGHFGCKEEETFEKQRLVVGRRTKPFPHCFEWNGWNSSPGAESTMPSLFVTDRPPRGQAYMISPKLLPSLDSSPLKKIRKQMALVFSYVFFGNPPSSSVQTSHMHASNSIHTPKRDIKKTGQMHGLAPVVQCVIYPDISGLSPSRRRSRQYFLFTPPRLPSLPQLPPYD